MKMEKKQAIGESEAGIGEKPEPELRAEARIDADFDEAEVKDGFSLGSKRPVPVWSDPDDHKEDQENGHKHHRVNLDPDRLVQNFELVYGPTPSWAQLKSGKTSVKAEEVLGSGDEDDEAVDVLQTSKNLSQGKLSILRVEDLNSAGRTEGAIIRSVDFHPTKPVGLVAGSSGIVSLYQVDGSRNAPIQSFSFENFPLRKAQFCSAGEEIYATSGLVPHFYCYDMRTGVIRRVKPSHTTKHETIRNLIPSPDDKVLLAVGHRGNMYLFSKNSKEVIETFSVNSEVKDVAFSPDGGEMIVHGDDGDVYRWNMNIRQCVEKFSGKANFDGTSLAVSSNYIACGSTSGFVSIFNNKYEAVSDTQMVGFQHKKPIRELGNLQTVVTHLKINCTEEILAMASVDKDNAIRLVHLSSGTTFPRFPFVNANYGRCNSIAFSPNSGYLSIGNNRGCAYLFRLKHYSSY